MRHLHFLYATAAQLAVAVFLTTAFSAQAYPVKPVTIVVPVAAGGSVTFEFAGLGAIEVYGA